jgi:hypothetical protein
MLTRPDVFLNNFDVVVTVMRGMHVEEAKDVQKLVNNGSVAEAAYTGGVARQIQGVCPTRLPVANVGEAAAITSLIVNKIRIIHFISVSRWRRGQCDLGS